MTVYVAPIIIQQRYSGFGFCRLFATDVDELHSFAEKIGMRRNKFFEGPRLPHYILTLHRRRLAIKAGAISETGPVIKRAVETHHCRTERTKRMKAVARRALERINARRAA